MDTPPAHRPQPPPRLPGLTARHGGPRQLSGFLSQLRGFKRGAEVQFCPQLGEEGSSLCHQLLHHLFTLLKGRGDRVGSGAPMGMVGCTVAERRAELGWCRVGDWGHTTSLWLYWVRS